MWSIRKGNLDIVKYLVEQTKANVNQADKRGKSPLLISAMFGHLNILKYLIET